MKKGQIGVTIAALLLVLLALGTGRDAQAVDVGIRSFDPDDWAKVGQPETRLVVFEGNYQYPMTLDDNGNVSIWRNRKSYGLRDSSGNEILPCEFYRFYFL